MKRSVSLTKPRFCQHERHPKIRATNFDVIFHHSARVRKQETFKILDFVILYVLKIPQTDGNTVFNPVPPPATKTRLLKSYISSAQWGLG
jgi:hypothetical protein